MTINFKQKTIWSDSMLHMITANVTKLLSISDTLIPAIFTLIGVYIGGANQRKIHQDDQTDWVVRLTKIADTPDKEMGQGQILTLESCLRIFPFEETFLAKKLDSHKDSKWFKRFEYYNPLDRNHTTSFKKFTNCSIQFCSEINKAINTKKTNNVQPEIIRLIARGLLKYHWEDTSHQNLFFLIRIFYWKKIYLKIHTQKILDRLINKIEPKKAYPTTIK